MENREFRNELKIMWLSRFLNSAKKPETPSVKIVTTSDIIWLTAMFTCGSLILMGAGIAVVAVLA